MEIRSAKRWFLLMMLQQLHPLQCRSGQRAGGRGFGGGGGGGNESLSPDGKRALYIKDWNLWVRDVASGKQTQLTTDGVTNFGYATDNAGWKSSDRPVVRWSPDSKKIATFKQDQRNVSDMYLVPTVLVNLLYAHGNIHYLVIKIFL
jgi:hypothetical protein